MLQKPKCDHLNLFNIFYKHKRPFGFLSWTKNRLGCNDTETLSWLLSVWKVLLSISPFVWLGFIFHYSIHISPLLLGSPFLAFLCASWSGTPKVLYCTHKISRQPIEIATGSFRSGAIPYSLHTQETKPFFFLLIERFNKGKLHICFQVFSSLCRPG